MKKITTTLLSTIFALLLFSQCGEDSPVPEGVNPLVWATDQLKLTEADNRFGFHLLKTVNAEAGEAEKNVFISPLSVATALSMTYNGADGTTKEAMQNTLKINDFTIEELNQTYQGLLERLPNLDPEVELSIANSLWWNSVGIYVYPEFIDANTEAFSSELSSLPFQDPTSVDIINSWVSDATNATIPEIIQEIDPNEVMFLINAIYFKSGWRFPFDPDLTTNETFYKADGTTTPVEMMNHNEALPLPFLYGDNFRAVDMAYADSIYSMTIFQPNEGEDINEFIATLNVEEYQTWLNSFYTQGISLHLPKFNVEAEYSLKDALTTMGMGIAFDEANADLTKIGTAGGNLYISRVIHKTFIEVDEIGTEASGATVVAVADESVPPSMNLNRPFFFVIRENVSNAILFMGKIMVPEL